MDKEEEIFREKFHNDVKQSGILSKLYRVTCAMCRAPIKQNEITTDNVHQLLQILVCNTCSKRTCKPSTNAKDLNCEWCGMRIDGHFYARFAWACNNCHRKFCTTCLYRLKGDVTCRWTCAFCDLRCLWEDRAICSAVFLEGDISEAEAEKKKILSGENEKFWAIDCVICLRSEARVALIPCGHVCLCDTCLPSYKENFNTCPMCKDVYQNTLKVFF